MELPHAVQRANTDRYTALHPLVSREWSCFTDQYGERLYEVESKMAQPALDSLPQSTLEEKFSALEIRFAALEKACHHHLPEIASTVTDKSIDESTEVAVPKVCHCTSNKNTFGDLED